jgi:predicted amidophosphoribosyltransferase
LSASERYRNLVGAMRASPPPATATALIVDDIVTTGASLAEAARALSTAGWPVAGAAVIAATPRRHRAA